MVTEVKANKNFKSNKERGEHPMSDTTLIVESVCIGLGKPYSLSVLEIEGAYFEINASGGADMLLCYPDIRENELQSIKAGPNRYALYEYNASNGITLALWMLKFYAPIGYIDAPFHAGLYSDDRIHKYLQRNEDGRCKNMVFITSLDTQIQIVVNCSMITVDLRLIERFQSIIKKQISQNVSRQSYNAAIDEMYRYSTKELFERTNSYPISQKIHMDAGIFL